MNALPKNLTWSNAYLTFVIVVMLPARLVVGYIPTFSVVVERNGFMFLFKEIYK